jgi:D-aspartate ligase
MIRRLARVPTAYVVGGFDLVRSLVLAGISPVTVGGETRPMRFSRFVHSYVALPDPWREPVKLVDALIEHPARQTQRPLLIYDGDGMALALGRQRDRVEAAFRVCLPQGELIEQLVDKRRFHRLAQRLGLPVPPTQLLQVRDGDLPRINVDFPAILKPAIRPRSRWRPILGDAKALTIPSHADLARLWPILVQRDLDAVLQGRIEGSERGVETYHVYVGRDGEVIGDFTGRKIRTLPKAYGDSTALTTTSAPDVAEIGLQIIRRLGLTGVAKVDFKRDSAGQLFLLEVNPRFSLWHHLGACAGVNIPALAWQYLTGDAPRVPRARASPDVTWCHLPMDYRAARSAGIPLTRWLRWALRCPAKNPVSLDDPFGCLWAIAGHPVRRHLQAGSDALRSAAAGRPRWQH